MAELKNTPIISQTPSEFIKLFSYQNDDMIVFNEESSFKMFLLILGGVELFFILLSIAAHSRQVLWGLLMPISVFMVSLFFPKDKMEFNKKSKELIIYRKGITSGVKVHNWNDLILSISHNPGRVTNLKIDIINKAKDEMATCLFLGNNDIALKAFIEYLNDFMSGRPIKEHYYIEKKADKQSVEED
jgi:hypothetical protein